MSITNLHTDSKFRAALARAAAKAGVDISTLRSDGCTTDRTWGDRCGVVFFGASLDVCERAAQFFLAYAAKLPRKSSYDAQSSLSYCGRMHFSKFSNGAQGWHRGELPAAPKPYPIGTDGFMLERVEACEGVAVNTVYYPCAD